MRCHLWDCCFCCSISKSCPYLCDPMNCSTPGFPVLHHLLELAQTHVCWVGDAIQPSQPLLFLPSIFPSIRGFSNEWVLHIRCPKYWSFHFSISPSNEYSGFISFRVDWLDLLTFQGTLKSLLQHHSSRASIIWLPAFLMVQLTSLHYYCKNHSFDYTDFVSKVMPLLFNMQPRFVIDLLSKSCLISWQQSPSAVIFGAQENNLSLFTLFPHLLAMKW